MKTLNKFLMSSVFILLLISCDDFDSNLDVQNLNAPNDQILLSDATALKASASGIVNSWFQITHDNLAVGSALSLMSDNFTCSWTNYAMRDLSSEPRVEFNNTSSYSYAYIGENYFNAMHTILADSNNLIIALDNGIEFGTNGDENEMIEAIARYGQALSTGYLALVFDRVWTSDESGPLNGGEPIGYEQAMSKALEFLDLGIQVASTNSFTLPTDWIPGNTYSSTDLAKLMNSMGARMLTYNSRNTSERDATDWTKVLNYANNGITQDFAPLMDDITWFDDLKWTLSYWGWGRVDMYVVNMMDSNTPEVWPTGQSTVPQSTSTDARLLSDFSYLSSQNFIASRGEYHYSSYRHSRYDLYISDWTVPSPDFLVAENETFKAEAMLRTGNVSGAATILNSTSNPRKSRGTLPDVLANASDIEDAIHYERFVECANTGMGTSFFEMRKQNLLLPGTILHFPIPGAILATAGVEYYTFGGSTGIAGTDYSNGGWR